MDPHGPDQRPHVPPPSLWPVGFAVGIAVLLTGLIVGWHIVALGAILTVVFGFLWVRDATADMRGAHVAEVEPERREVRAATAPRADEGEWGAPPSSEAEVDRFPRSKFLEGATLGIGGVIGGIVTVPLLGFAVLPAFVDQERDEVDVGAVDDFPEGKFVITTFLAAPAEGEVSRRTAYVRNNGERDGQPSFTIVSNRCVHLGCPTQPNGLPEENAKKEEMTETTLVTRIPVIPAGFGCPCHGGQYDTEGNRTAGPPVRALDRYEFFVRDGRLWIGNTFSVSHVEKEGKEAVIHKYAIHYPGLHVDGPEQLLYPLSPPR